MTAISSYLTQDHADCDELFADTENAVSEHAWTSARDLFDRFSHATLRHFLREEETLFPAFEAQTGMQGGPTFVMRQEHGQMRDVLIAMEQALGRQDGQAYLGLSETFLMLLRQHNAKEEQILYPMCDRALSGEAEALVQRMEGQSA
jgi:hemerythrin-like domain-containing protein